ncbi:MAG: transcription termination/antitermination protein NusG [Afipia sp.]
MNEPSMPRWYVVQTQVHAEIKAAQNLIRQGYAVYLPRYLKRRRHARKIDLVASPLFARYLFVSIDTAAQRWRSVQSTFGVARLVMNGDQPAFVPDTIVAGLRQREDDKGFVRMERASAFSPGEKVRVLSGAFLDSIASFERMSDSDRVAVLLDFLGQKVRVTLDRDMVAAA